MAPLILRLQKKIEGPSRFTIVISTKIDKRSTKRNRMRRLIRESLRHLAPVGVSGVCIVKENISSHSYKEVETMLRGLIHERVCT